MATLGITFTNNLAALVGPLPGPVTNSYVVDASPFSRDKTIFAGETLFDAFGQEIPLSGSALGVPDGTKIWARPVLETDGSTPDWGGWREIDTTFGGVWSGKYPQCKRLYGWMRFEVVADGSDQVHTMTTRFGVGIVALVESQSEFHRILQQTRDNGQSNPIGHTDEFFQLTWRGATGSDEDSVVNGGLYVLNDNTPRSEGGGFKTYGMDRMAAMVHRNQVMMRVCLDTRSGAPETQPLTNSQTGGSDVQRKRDNTPIMAANMKADGAILNIAHSDHFKLLSGNNEIRNKEFHVRYLNNAYYGQDEDGNTLSGVNFSGPFTSVDVLFALDGNPRGDIEYTWADNALYPEFRSLRPPVHLEGNSWRLNTSTTPGHYDAYGVRVVNGLDASKRWFWPGKFQIMAVGDDVHPADTQYAPLFGQTRQGAQYFGAMLMACGVLPMTKHASFDRYQIASDGSYVLFWFSEGPVTTIERSTIAPWESRAPANLAKPGYDNVQAVGFLQDGTAAKYTQVEIVAADGVTLAGAGAIKVYALSGEDFRTDPIPTYMQLRSGLDYDTGPSNINDTETMDIAAYPHYPVFDPLGTLGYEAPLVNPPGPRVPTTGGFDGAFGNQMQSIATESASGPEWS